MSVIKTRGLKWTKQPFGAAAINSGNPFVLAAGLRSVWTGGAGGRDGLGSVHGTLTNGAAVAATEHGLAFALDGVNDFVSFGLTRGLETSNNKLVCFARIQRTGAMVDLSGIINSGKNNLNEGGWMLAGTATNALSFYIRNTSSSWVSVTSAITNINQWYDVCATWDGANIEIYLDGILQATTACTSISYPTSVVQDACLGQYIAEEFPGNIAIAGFGDGLLTAGQVAELSRNPWQIFAPQKRNIWVGVAGGGTAVTADNVNALEWLANIGNSAAAPVEYSGSLAASAQPQFEFAATAAANLQTPAAWLASIVRDTLAGIEYRGTLTADSMAQIDYAALLRADAPALFEYGLTTRADHVSPINWLATLQRDSAVPLEWTGGVLVTADAALPIEWRSTVSADGVMPISISQVLAVNQSIPVEFGAGVVRDQAAVLEWLATIGANALLPLSTVAVVRGDQFFMAEWGGTAAAAAFVSGNINVFHLDARGTVWHLDARGTVWKIIKH